MTLSDIPRDRTRDKALLISIEYKKSSYGKVKPLATAHADLERMHDHLIQHWGYLKENITVLRDDDKDELMVPTRDYILREIDNLVKDVQPGDRRVFFFAGHGYQIKNHRGTEEDGLDEVILTAKHSGPPNLTEDLKPEVRRGIIVDNELRQLLVNRIPRGAKLVAIADTCHSGTLFDLDWHWRYDSREPTRLVTIPALSLKKLGPRKLPVPVRRSAKLQILGAAQEYDYAYRSDAHDPPRHRSQPQPQRHCQSDQHQQHHQHGGRALTGPKRVNGLLSHSKTMLAPLSVTLGSCFTEKGFVQCASPTQEEEADVEEKADVLSISSARDDQLAWSGSIKGMTPVSVSPFLSSTMLNNEIPFDP
ncbi:peptidase C14 [Trametopsis cervina]|nr:peptidase C14 [Trametopsis cervina]